MGVRGEERGKGGGLRGVKGDKEKGEGNGGGRMGGMGQERKRRR